MKSIEDILNLINSIVSMVGKEDRIKIALVGGYAAIAHGVERTTSDADFCVYTELIHKEGAVAFVDLMDKSMPENFEIRLVEGSRIPDDPFRHDVIFIEDKSRQYPRIDFIIAKYKWEFEGIEKAGHLEDIAFPVLTKPYLIAMKLKAGSLKDDYDIAELYDLSDEKERKETTELAGRIHRDKKLDEIIKRSKAQETQEEPEEELLK
ncbi:MAG: hypothetical protein HQL09_08490 [Nitrospirae bacterium]|nr:hypothetical protein [Nitrospirota bacterium]